MPRDPATSSVKRATVNVGDRVEAWSSYHGRDVIGRVLELGRNLLVQVGKRKVLCSSRTARRIAA